MTDTYEKESRKQWYDATTAKPGREQIQIGCLQRIATATEAMAINHQRLIDENQWLSKSRKTYRDECESLKRRLAALKGANTKLRKKLEAQKELG